MKYKVNFKIVLPIIFLAIISVVTIYSASMYTSKSLGNLALKQTIWYIIGAILKLFAALSLILFDNKLLFYGIFICMISNIHSIRTKHIRYQLTYLL